MEELLKKDSKIVSLAILATISLAPLSILPPQNHNQEAIASFASYFDCRRSYIPLPLPGKPHVWHIFCLKLRFFCNNPFKGQITLPNLYHRNRITEFCMSHEPQDVIFQCKI